MHYEAQILCYPACPSLADWRYVVWLVDGDRRLPVATGAAYFDRERALEAAEKAAGVSDTGWIVTGKPQLGDPITEIVRLDTRAVHAPGPLAVSQARG